MNSDFQPPTINIIIMLLFLPTTQHRALENSERIQHTLNVYTKILQPKIWAQWVSNKADSNEEGNVTVYQDFIDSSTIKYNKSLGSNDEFKCLLQIV